VPDQPCWPRVEPFLQGPVYDPELTGVMGLAFDKARTGLHDSGQPAVVQEIIAKRIIAKRIFEIASAGSAILRGSRARRWRLWEYRARSPLDPCYGADDAATTAIEKVEA
jgi:hypothetical protein